MIRLGTGCRRAHAKAMIEDGNDQGRPGRPCRQIHGQTDDSIQKDCRATTDVREIGVHHESKLGLGTDFGVGDDGFLNLAICAHGCSGLQDEVARLKRNAMGLRLP